VRGELRLRPYNQDSDLLLDVEEVLVRTKAGAERPMVITAARRVPEAILATLDGVRDRDAADQLRGAQVCVRRGDFPPLEDGEFYACDVEGARVVCDGAEVGRVTALRSYPSVDVLVVAGARNVEVPLTDAFILRVDPDAKLVLLRTLEDLE